MASTKEIPAASRPLSQRRPSISGSPSSFSATRPMTHSRNGSHHSALSGALNANHRISRRKSMTNPTANVAAVAAALNEAGDKVAPLPIGGNQRRGTISKSVAAARSALAGSLPSPPASLPATHNFAADVKAQGPSSAIDDDSNEMSAEEGANGSGKTRVRRASDGQPLTKDGKKSNRIELKCEKCGKGYKHSSCLTKHLWEHTPEWSYTSKLLISKHQQVQLLEAASVLVQMNVKPESDTTPPDSAKDFASDADSASPAASGYSEHPDGRSSADTTPPPQSEAFMSYHDNSKRLSSGSAFDLSRSQQSASGSMFPGHTASGSGFSHNRHGSSDRRPLSSGRNNTGQEDRDLAAAVELLSCSFNSNGGRDARLPVDAPPVPPLPAQYLDQASYTSTSFINSFPSRQMPESFTRGGPTPSREVKMDESEDSVMGDDDDFDTRSRARGSEEDDDLMFGRMED